MISNNKNNGNGNIPEGGKPKKNRTLMLSIILFFVILGVIASFVFVP